MLETGSTLCPTLTHPRNTIDFTQPHEPGRSEGPHRADRPALPRRLRPAEKGGRRRRAVPDRHQFRVRRSPPMANGTRKDRTVRRRSRLHPGRCIARSDRDQRRLHDRAATRSASSKRAAPPISSSSTPRPSPISGVLQDAGGCARSISPARRSRSPTVPTTRARSPISRCRTGPTSTPRRGSPNWAAAAAACAAEERRRRRRALRAAFGGALLLALAGCAELGLGGHHATGVPEKPEQLVVRSFAAPARAIVLDPSFGFSLRRGQPGVPRAERAAGVGRAAAFALGAGDCPDLAGGGARRLRETGPRARRPRTPSSSAANSRRSTRGGAAVSAGSDRARARAGSSPTRASGAPGGRVLLTVHADSDQIAGEGGSGDTTKVRGVRVTIADANRYAARVGREIGRQIVDFARRADWLAAGR